ncbi:MAG: murein L,D-transpeptidase [Candidatus Eremiobacteraeota bacterium]|nr:murein L,D-transpeptidase [Candidatus Eremiobacteraeota bacterium]
MMKRFLLTALFALSACAASCADPVVPWATPQSYPEETQAETEKPLFERVMEEERRRKEQGIKDTVDAESLKANQANKSAPRPTEVKPLENSAANPVAPQEFKPLERGAKGARVEEVQKILIALGFGLPAGADGDYGGQTVDAVKAFQSSATLPVTGKLDKQTFDELVRRKPQPGKRVWEDAVAVAFIPEAPTVSNKKARVLIDLSEHRLSVYDGAGKVQRVFPVASGARETPTDEGIKVVCEKLEDPTKLAEKLWPDSKGAAFGKRLIDLNWYDPETGSQTVSDEELHGTYELNSIGSFASHGCVRLTNESIEWLYQNLKLGDIVVIRE